MGSVTGKMMIGEEDTFGDEEDEGEYLTLPYLRYLGSLPSRARQQQQQQQTKRTIRA